MSLEEKLQQDDKKIADEKIANESPQDTINRLAMLPPVEYEAVRSDEAKRINFRTGVLDKAVEGARKESESDNDDVVINDEPYSGFVNGDALLTEIEAIVKRHMVLPKGASPVVALWIASTYVYDAFRVFPKLAVISPEKRCGKSTLLSILDGICSRSLIASNITPSAIFRAVDLWRPSLIIDEADTFLAGRNDDLIGIINSGHTKTTAFVIRTVGDEHIPQKFSTWAPMAFASIKGLVDTVMDRSIIILLRRRMVNERVQRLTVDFKEDSSLIRQKLVKWAGDNFHKLKANHIEPPEIPNDRAIDNWMPLFTIAHVVGGNWPERVEASYFILNSEAEEETAAIMLLRDIKAIFEETGLNKIHSIILTEKLIELEERPWSEWKRGKPMTQNSLSKILKTFGIHSKSLRAGVPENNLKGFKKNQFSDAFLRYIPPTSSNTPIQSVTTSQVSKDKTFGGFQSVTDNHVVTDQKAMNSTGNNGCDVVTIKKPLLAEGGIKATNKEEF